MPRADNSRSLIAGGTIGAGAIASGAVLFDPAALPTAHATRAQVFCIADALAILPGSGGDGGLWLYDPDATSNILKIWQDGGTGYFQFPAQDFQARFRQNDGSTVAIIRGEDFDDGTASQSGSKCVISPIGQHNRLAVHNLSAAPTARANHADMFSMDVAASAEMWLQNEGGVLHQMTGLDKSLASAVTNVTTTLANLTGLTQNVLTGTYVGRLVLPINNGLAADGYKFDLGGGTATVSSVHFGIASLVGATLGVRTSTALTTALTVTVLADTSDVYVDIPVEMVVSGAGTIIPRQAKNADAAGATLTHRVGGNFILKRGS